MTHWCTPSHANRSMCCAAFFWEWTARHTASSTPHTPSLDTTQHTPTNQPNTEIVHGAINNEMTMINEKKGIGQ